MARFVDGHSKRAVEVCIFNYRKRLVYECNFLRRAKLYEKELVPNIKERIEFLKHRILKLEERKKSIIKELEENAC